MGVEARHKSGQLYFYKKRREGNRVISEYVGGGQLVVLAEGQAQIERERKEREREEVHAARMSMAEIDQQLDSFSRMVDSLMEAHLVALGFHQHKRQWRKKRNGRQT
jgi:hypothetical protein